MTSRQNFFASNSVSSLPLRHILVNKTNLLSSALEFGITLLEGGNKMVQNSMMNFFLKIRDENFFQEIHYIFQRLMAEKKDGTSNQSIGKDCHWKHMERVLRFLQLLCEGHNTQHQVFHLNFSHECSYVEIIFICCYYLL